MVQRVLVFESDPVFAQEVQQSFEALGAKVDVANDGPRGLELATANRPDLILLSIELPGMNGFLVCKKLKKQDGLQDVPLLILSSEATEDVFEQHKKLRTRAEDYLHKPIAFSALLERAKQFVKFETNGAGANDGESELEIADLDEEVILVADDSEPPLPMPTEPEQFADAAIDALLSEPESVKAKTPIPFPAPRVADRIPPPSRLEPRSVPEPFAPVAPAPSAASSQELQRVQQELQQAQARLAQLDSELKEADRRAKDALQELQASKQRASNAEKSFTEASKKGGVSSRELLDLREQLNRKDRELLGLRDQVSSRDKQLIEQSDKSLTLERELADQSDKNVDLQRDLDKAKEITDALQADKEGAKKRLDDLKARLDRSEAKCRELSGELSGIAATQAKQLEAVQHQHAEALAVVAGVAAQEKAQQQRQHEAALEALRKAHADELADQREERSVAAAAQREQAEQREQATLAAQRNELGAETERRLEAQRQQHESVVSQALAAHEKELSSTRQSLQDKHASEMRQSSERSQQETGRLSRLLGEIETKQQLLEDQLEEAETARADALTRLGRLTVDRDQKAELVEDLQAQLDHLLAQRGNDEQVIERVRKALAIGLSLLDEHKRSALDESAQE